MFYSLEVVDRGRESQLQVAENYICTMLDQRGRFWADVVQM